MIDIKIIKIMSPALAGLFLLIAGCGSGSSEDHAGEMVHYAYTSRIRGFDPVKAGDVPSANAIAKIYEGLLQYSYLERPYKVEPALAASMPEVSDDGLVYTFKIRKGIYFQDDACFTNTAGKGRELVAEDFVYSIKRVADMNNTSTGYWVYNNRIEGLDDFRKASRKNGKADYSAEIEGLKALDRYTLQIRLIKPYPQLLWILTMHYAYAVPREAVEHYEGEFVNHPVGTGPYKLQSWKRNYRLELVRNPKWAETGRKELYPSKGEEGDREAGLLEDAGKPIPFIDRLIYYVMDDSSTQWLKFVTGELEVSGISRDNWDAVLSVDKDLSGSLKKRDISLIKSPTLDVFYIGFNMDDPVVGASKDPEVDLKHRKLRQALTCAFNTEEWLRFWNGRMVRAKGPIPPGVAGYSDAPAKYPFDLEKAKKLLAEAGYPEGISNETGKRLKLTIELGSADSQTRESVALLGSFFQKIGVTLHPSYNNFPIFLKKMERRQCQIYRLGWIADYPDAENFLQLFYGPNSSPGPNHSNYVNSEFDKLYDTIRVMPDSPERTKIYQQMADILVEDAPWIYTVHPMSYALVHGWLGNYKPHDFPYGMTKYRKIDLEKRMSWKKAYSKQYWKE